MLRFPDTQGTILVQCPVCSHRFTFDPEMETETGFGKNETEIPSFQFKPTFQNYKDLMLDLLYAPIDYLKSKQGNRKKEIPWIPILLFSIFFLYLWKWSLAKDPKLTPSNSAPVIEGEPNFGNTPFDFLPPDERMPASPGEGENQPPQEPKSPGFEI
ncbi:hypothetical protein LEP1GSC202_3904 [Leptospira yanagawae serovar Saopaulo str. Sao Paulo = ATCC 700523]|uniref:Uncharacterized protein n=1 Tax=Leptospira yanagawae serovar Saopaulo str. Sao Paulo = ATCC 700523 TaxID=1249483 RepID=A0A5E8HIP3_9LEPT|nr:hypothetical protein [Leptospira yanagawae]EOQ90498.1 hypothetical protein LEP1GSC202_3904 [Leptospira yanagawae serovar Saopaulo str. Sao Paulo = ATCC 700523]